MATKEEILDSIASMTVLELSELLKEFEEKFGVTAAAPMAVAGPTGGGAGRRRAGRGGAGRVRRRPHRRRREEDPGHQGGALAHQPRPEGGQGPGRQRPRRQGAGEGLQGGRPEGQGPARGRRRHRRGQVARSAIAGQAPETGCLPEAHRALSGGAGGRGAAARPAPSRPGPTPGVRGRRSTPVSGRNPASSHILLWRTLDQVSCFE